VLKLRFDIDVQHCLNCGGGDRHRHNWPLAHSLDGLLAPPAATTPADERFARALAFLASEKMRIYIGANTSLDSPYHVKE
jgi:hypothetical protein